MPSRGFLGFSHAELKERIDYVSARVNSFINRYIHNEIAIFVVVLPPSHFEARCFSERDVILFFFLFLFLYV